MEGQVELFRQAREFLESEGYAKNVRIQDVVAVLSAAFTGTINASQRQASTYSGAGSDSGPLNTDGNMPMSSAGVIIGSAVVMPYLWTAADEANINQAWQELCQNTSHVVNVAGTDVISKHVQFSASYASLGAGGVATGPIYGVMEGAREQRRQPEPVLVVMPGDQVQQFLKVRRTTTLGAVTVTPELALLMVVADKGEDAA